MSQGRAFCVPKARSAQVRAFLLEAIFNYVLTVEKYVFTLSVWFCSYNCFNWAFFKKKARKSAQNYANDLFFFRSCDLIFHFFSCLIVKKLIWKGKNILFYFYLWALVTILHKWLNNALVFQFSTSFSNNAQNFQKWYRKKKTRFF